MRYSRGSVELEGEGWPVANLDYIRRGMQAPNCRLQEIDLRFEPATLRDRGLAPLFEAARSCRHLKALKVAVERDEDDGIYEMDGDASEALSGLLQSSTVLTTLRLSNFSFAPDGFGILASGLAN